MSVFSPSGRVKSVRSRVNLMNSPFSEAVTISEPMTISGSSSLGPFSSTKNMWSEMSAATGPSLLIVALRRRQPEGLLEEGLRVQAVCDRAGQHRVEVLTGSDPGYLIVKKGN